jgi:hypothetical protein
MILCRGELGTLSLLSFAGVPFCAKEGNCFTALLDVLDIAKDQSVKFIRRIQKETAPPRKACGSQRSANPLANVVSCLLTSSNLVG